MNSRAILNLSILAIVIVLGAVVFYPPQQSTETKIETALTSLTPEAVHTITITKPNQTPINFVNQKQGWLINAPFTVNANPQRLEKILQLITQPSHSQYNIDESNLAKYGLDNPQVVIAFNDVELRFGGSDPIHQRRYILIDNRIHLITDLVSHILKQPVTQFIDLALIPGNQQITKLQLPEFSLKLIQGKWNFERPHNSTINQDAAQKFVDEWRYAQALSVELVKRAPPTDANNKVSIATSSQSVEFILFDGESETKLIRTDLPIQYQLSPDSVQTLLQHGRELIIK